jgi:hypothetical protein
MSARGFVSGFDLWTPEDDARLRVAYVKGGIALAREVLPARSAPSLFHRARKLGLSRRPRWTAEDDRRLTFEWAEGLSLATVAKRLGRTQAATYWRAQQIGLPLGVPDGFEYFSAAAERTGYATKQLRAILATHGVRLHATLSRTSPEKRPRRMHFVDPLLVDDAVAAWVQAEPVEAAARRLGICGESLRRRLARVGVENAPGSRQHIRVTAEQVEAANGIAVWKHRNSLKGRAPGSTRVSKTHDARIDTSAARFTPSRAASGGGEAA